LHFETNRVDPEHIFQVRESSYADSDIRSLWEPARLQNATILFALASNREGPEAEGLITRGLEAVREWIDDNPFPSGLHYISAMECGLRIPIFTACLKYSCRRNPVLSKQIFSAIYLHAWWVSRRLSLYSSRGNHTICEAVGLVFAGWVFVSTLEGREWFEEGVNLLYREAQQQILEDGGPAEQSFSYHRFVLDLYWLMLNFLESNGFSRSTTLRESLTRAEEFMAAFQDEKGNMPTIGDSDDGCAVAPGMMPQRERATTAAGAVRVFRESGYTVIRTSNGAVLTFDHGPLGMPPFYNHGHADALSITLSKQGEAILVDPGTYRYNGEPSYRRYFKSTRAHNTVTVDGFDQAEQVTGFIWSRPFHCELIGAYAKGEDYVVDASHDGYSRLAGGSVYHTRKLLFFDSRHFLCRDSFTGSGTHEFELNFHIHPDAEVRREGRWRVVEKGAARVFLMLRDGDDFTMICGCEEPPFGWFSPSYGKKKKSAVLCARKRGRPDEIVFTTIICTADAINGKHIEEVARRI
jgi:hypothetical protein